MKRRMNEDAREEWQDLKKHWNASRKPKGQREWDSVTRSISASKKAGEPRYKYEDIVDYDGEEWIVKGSWVREDKGENEYKLVNMDDTETIYVLQSEIEKPMHESSEIHPELTCDRCGFTDRQEDYFDIVGDEILCDRCRRRLMKESKKSFHGIPDAYLIDTGSHSEPEVEYRGITLEYGDVDDNLWNIYQEDHPEDPEGKDYPRWVKKNPRYVECVLEELYDKAVAENPEQFDEGWLGDKMKAGWGAVKNGAKKVGKAIGDVFKGPFRKGDQIVMKGENGEEFKGTIKDFSLSSKTYEVMLGNPVNEGLQEDVLDMADREDELVWMIQDSFWHLADLGDPDILRELIENCVELEKVKPGKLKEIISEEY